MKFFIAQAVTGQDLGELNKEMHEIYKALCEAGHDKYCTLDEPASFQDISYLEKFKHVFKEIDKSDGMLVIVRNEKKSEGMLMEIGYTLGQKKKIIMLIQEDVKNTYTPDLVDKVIRFKDKEDMLNKMRELNLE